VVGEEFPSRAEIPIETLPSDDNRSYHINSEKVNRQLGFQPKYSVDYAVRELCGAFKEGLLPDSMTDDRYFNVQRLQRLQVS
jgi:nucleoside-diphosphate-sugar epimerase